MKKKNKKKIDIVFIVFREESLGHKDIDHFLPFLYFLSKSRHIKYTARGIILENKAIYTNSKDPRIKLFNDLKNVDFEYLYESKFIYKLRKFLELKSKSTFANLFNRICNKFYLKQLNIKKEKFDLKSRLGKNFIESRSPLIITLHSNEKAQKLIPIIKKINTKSKWMVAPHGTTVLDNKMLSDFDLKKNHNFEDKNNYKNIDYFLGTSKRDVKDAINNGLDRSKGYLIGSPRYCKEWLKIKSNFNLDGKKVIVNKNYKIRILFIMPKRHDNIFWDEIIRTVDFLTSYEELEVIIVNYHPFHPKFTKNIINRKNLRYYLIFKEHSTSNLIEWSDIVFHVGSSVQFEFFIRDKISVFPRYLMCNTLISDKYYNAGLNLSNRDELRSFCNDAVSSLEKLKKNYKKNYDTSNKKFINDYVNANCDSVKKNIEKIFLKIRKSI